MLTALLRLGAPAVALEQAEVSLRAVGEHPLPLADLVRADEDRGLDAGAAGGCLQRLEIDLVRDGGEVAAELLAEALAVHEVHRDGVDGDGAALARRDRSVVERERGHLLQAGVALRGVEACAWASRGADSAEAAVARRRRRDVSARRRAGGAGDLMVIRG